jgi:hypothetical protein
MELTRDEIMGRFIGTSMQCMENAYLMGGSDEEVVLTAISSLLYVMDYGGQKVPKFLVAPQDSFDINIAGAPRTFRQINNPLAGIKANLSGSLRQSLIGLTGAVDSEEGIVPAVAPGSGEGRIIDMFPVEDAEEVLRSEGMIEFVAISYFDAMSAAIISRVDREMSLEDKLFWSFAAVFSFWDQGQSPLPPLIIAPIPEPGASEVLEGQKYFPGNVDHKVSGNLCGSLRTGFLKAYRNIRGR